MTRCVIILIEFPDNTQIVQLLRDLPDRISADELVDAYMVNLNGVRFHLEEKRFRDCKSIPKRDIDD